MAEIPAKLWGGNRCTIRKQIGATQHIPVGNAAQDDIYHVADIDEAPAVRNASKRQRNAARDGIHQGEKICPYRRPVNERRPQYRQANPWYSAQSLLCSRLGCGIGIRRHYWRMLSEWLRAFFPMDFYRTEKNH